jgi:DNA-binding MarR family transcriptional regulator
VKFGGSTAEGYLRKVDNVSDRRQHVVALSPKGLRIWRAAFQDYRRALDAFESGLKPAERKGAERVLRQIFTGSLSTC